MSGVTNLNPLQSLSNLLGKQWYRVKAALCIMMLIAAMPLCFIFTTCVWLFGRKSEQHDYLEASLRRTVLVSGLAHTKGLHIAKTLGKAGHRVILADLEEFGCSAAQWSCFISKFYTVPDLNSLDGNEAYIKGMVNVAKTERIDWYIPVSHEKTAVSDSIVKQRLAEVNPQIKCLIFDDPKLTAILDDKPLFLEECNKLNLKVPYFKKVCSLAEVREVAKKELLLNFKSHYFLKPLFPVPEADRLNFTPIPSDSTEFEKFLAHYESKLNCGSPYLVNQFIKGKEFAANAIVSKGNLQAFHVSPSSAMQIDFDVTKHPEIKKWVEEFCKAKKITGGICFDFLEEDDSGEVYCIECNPRFHSCVVSYHMKPNLEAAIRGAMEDQFQLPTPSEPSASSKHVYWLYNEIAKLGLFQQGIGEFIYTLMNGRDAVFEASDPWPFFILNHYQMPVMLLKAFMTGKRWTITNYNMGQLR